MNIAALPLVSIPDVLHRSNAFWEAEFVNSLHALLVERLVNLGRAGVGKPSAPRRCHCARLRWLPSNAHTSPARSPYTSARRACTHHLDRAQHASAHDGQVAMITDDDTTPTAMGPLPHAKFMATSSNSDRASPRSICRPRTPVGLLAEGAREL